MLFQLVLEQLGSVADGQDDMLDAKVDQSMNLVQYHRLIAKLHQRLGQR